MSGGKRSRGNERPIGNLSVVLLLLIIPCLALQAGLPTGLPPVHEIPPEPGTYPSFYSVVQAPDGLLHVGGHEGIHSYDGRRWQYMPMPNSNLVRSLTHDGRDRLYVGGYGMFGYALQRPDGLLEFIDLTPPDDELPGREVLADIWQILVAPEGVYFAGVHHLFLYDPDSGGVRNWYHPDRFGVLTRHQDQTLIQYRGIGIKAFNGNGFELIEGGEQLPTHLYALLPLPDGGLVTLGRDGRWLRFHQGRVEPWQGGEELPSSDAFSASLTLPDQTLALAKPDGSLYIVNPETYRVRRFQLSNNYIVDLALANDGGLFLQSDASTQHVSWPSSWTRMGSDTGLRGRVYKVDYWQGQWLAVTNAGVHRTRRSENSIVSFERTDLTPFEAWDWLGFDEGEALLADSYQLIQVSGENRRALSSDHLYPRLLKPSRYNEQLLYVGTELGLALFERKGLDWSKRFSQKGFTGRVHSIVELSEGRVLAAIDGHGLIEIHLENDLTDIKLWQRYDPDQGLDYGASDDIELFMIDSGLIVASTAAGFFEWHDGHFKSTEMAGLEALRLAETAYQIKVAPDGTWWAYSHNHLLRRPPGEDWIVEDLTALNPGMIASLSFGDNGTVLVGGIATILEFDPQVIPVEPAVPSVVLRTALLTTADGRQHRLPLDGREIVIRHDLISMVFEYALPSYRRPELTRYQERLTGYEEYFADWSGVTRITYAYFEPGEYRFVVRARDGQDRVSESTPFEFVVLPPWYLTFWAKVLWVILILAVLFLGTYGLIKWRLARVNAERERLFDMVHQRTAELAAANSKLENMANLDGLTAVANRRRLDAYMAQSWDRCIQRQCELSVLLIDVDHFKEFNDAHGHQAGDDALRKVAEIISAVLRRNEDIVGRYGGEEFMCILPGAPESMAMEVAESIRRRIDDAFEEITVSVGLSTVRASHDEEFATLIERADRALYAAKQAGRNRVCRAD